MVTRQYTTHGRVVRLVRTRSCILPTVGAFPRIDSVGTGECRTSRRLVGRVVDDVMMCRKGRKNSRETRSGHVYVGGGRQLYFF